jgi:hypothetical protein
MQHHLQRDRDVSRIGAGRGFIELSHDVPPGRFPTCWLSTVRRSYTFSTARNVRFPVAPAAGFFSVENQPLLVERGLNRRFI